MCTVTTGPLISLQSRRCGETADMTGMLSWKTMSGDIGWENKVEELLFM